MSERMTDRKLLEAAARAAGIVLVPYTWNQGTGWDHEGFTEAGQGPDEWNPLEDDGQALRLAVKLQLRVNAESTMVYVDWWEGVLLCDVQEPINNDPCAATRRAIVRAAAATVLEKPPGP